MESLILKVTSMRKLTTPVSYVFYALLYIIRDKTRNNDMSEVDITSRSTTSLS